MSAAADDVGDADGEASPDGDDGRPDLAPDEKADMDLSGIDVDAVTEETEAESDPSDEGDEGPADAADALAPDDADGDGEASPYRMGDLYVEVLVVLLVAVVDEHGEDADVDPEDVREVANSPPFPLADAADDCLAEMLGTDGAEMTPQQALLAGTATVALTVLLKETDVLQDRLGELMENAEVSV